MPLSHQVGTLLLALILPVTAAPWPRHTIDASSKEDGKLGADGVRLADADGDKLPDVVTGWENGDAIRVCLNPGPGKSKAPWPGVTVGRVRGAEDAVLADLDNDGSLDVVTCAEGKTRTVFFHWAPPAASYLDATAWMTESVPATEGEQAWMYALPFDVDGVNGIDIVIGSKGGNAAMGWLESPPNPRDISAWKYHELHPAAWIMSIRSVDMDGDDDEDILYTDRKGEDSGVFWLENPGKGLVLRSSTQESEEGWIRHLLGHAGREVMFLDFTARSKPGAPLPYAVAVKAGDIRVGPEGRIPMPEGAGTGKAIRWGHIGGTPDIDLVLTCENAKGDLSGVWWYALGSDPGWHNISGPEGVKYDRIELLDLDADGDLDVMSCEERDNLGVFWYENPGE